MNPSIHHIGAKAQIPSLFLGTWMSCDRILGFAVSCWLAQHYFIVGCFDVFGDAKAASNSELSSSDSCH
jgi:hypothetical protein